MKILVIDDDVLQQKALGYQLLNLGHSVTVAADGKEALSLIGKNKDFDVVFCDIMMPVLTGPSFLLMLKKEYSHGLPTIIIISSLRDVEGLLKKVEVKYDYFFRKPIDVAELKRVVGEIAATKS